MATGLAKLAAEIVASPLFYLVAGKLSTHGTGLSHWILAIVNRSGGGAHMCCLQLLQLVHVLQVWLQSSLFHPQASRVAAFWCSLVRKCAYVPEVVSHF